MGDAVLRLLLAGGLGAVVGFERERRDRAAGLRTHVLVSIGAATFTIISAYGWHDYFTHVRVPAGTAIPAVDPSRVAAQIVSGIGFLGGGVILRSGGNVKGLTTAASIWAMGAVGMAAGSGSYSIAAIATALLLLTLTLMRRVNDLVHVRFHEDLARVSVRVANDMVRTNVIEAVEDQAANVSGITIEPAGIDRDDELVTLDIRMNAGVTKLTLSQQIARVPGVTEVRLHDVRHQDG